MKQFFEQYGGVALGILALLVLIAMITPVGNIIKTSLQGTVQTFSTSINSQVDDDLDAVSKIAGGIGTDIPFPGNIVNYNGQSSFSSTYTEADIIWPANYDFGNSVTIYAEFKGLNESGNTIHEFITNHEKAGIGLELKENNEMVFQLYSLENDRYYQTVSFEVDPNGINRVAGVFDGSEIRLYINGELKSVKTLSGNVKPSPYAVIVGNPNGTSTKDGSLNPNGEEIYRVGVFDGALTLEQIESLQYK